MPDSIFAQLKPEFVIVHSLYFTKVLERLSDQYTDLFFVAERRKSAYLRTQKIWVNDNPRGRATAASPTLI
jgi:hypothetical protein